MDRDKLQNQITDTFKKYGIEYSEESFNELGNDLIRDIAYSIEEIEDHFTELLSGDADLMGLLGFHCSTYNGQVYNEILSVVELIADSKFNSEIAKITGLTPSHVELIQYALCGRNLADYGTSPRGCWLTPIGRSLWDFISAYGEIIRQQGQPSQESDL